MKKIGKRVSLSLVGATFALVLGLVACRPSAAEDLDDQLITATIRERLRLDPLVPSTAVDVRTTAGIVTLRGTVPSMAGWGRAGILAQQVRGVRYVLNDLVVEADSHPGDQRIAREVRRVLLLDGMSLRDEVRINVDQGRVILSGAVDTWKQRDDVARIIRTVPGVGEIRNDLFVIGPAAEGRGAYIVGYGGLTSTLPPEIPTPAVAPIQHYPPTDAELSVAINEMLLRDPRVSSFRITPRVTLGQVVLQGTVTSLVAKVAAEKDVWRIPGVRQVINRLDVAATEVLHDDDRLLADVRSVLARDPYTDRVKVTPSVVDGVVYLFGIVDSELERAHAQEMVAAVPGVGTVENRLQVRPNSGPLVERPYFPIPPTTPPVGVPFQAGRPMIVAPAPQAQPVLPPTPPAGRK